MRKRNLIWNEQQIEEIQRRLGHVPVQALATPPKYKNRKVVQDGITFDSAKEARRWAVLEQMQAAGQISELRRQVAYELIPKQRRTDGKAERACAYVADFAYVQNGQSITEDVKGVKTRDYVIKRKLMLHVHGIHIKEV